MFGYIEWAQTQKKSILLKERTILHVRFCCISILRKPQGSIWLERCRVVAAARRLRKMGIAWAVFPEQFHYLKVFADHGVHPIPTLPLYRAMAAEVAQRAMERYGLLPGQAVIAVWAEHLGSEVQRTVTELCMRNRYVQLSAAGSGKALCRYLRRKYGAALVLEERPESLSRAALLLLFSHWEGPPPEGVVLNCFEEGAQQEYPLRLADQINENIPEECNRTDLLAALWQAGAVQTGQLEIDGNHSCA